MTKKPLIRIIKREDRARRESSAQEKSAKVEKPDASREIMATVKEWVHEVQHQRRAGQGQAFMKLFEGAIPNPNET